VLDVAWGLWTAADPGDKTARHARAGTIREVLPPGSAPAHSDDDDDEFVLFFSWSRGLESVREAGRAWLWHHRRAEARSAEAISEDKTTIRRRRPLGAAVENASGVFQVLGGKSAKGVEASR
jgi:hypothetical protein